MEILTYDFGMLWARSDTDKSSSESIEDKRRGMLEDRKRAHVYDVQWNAHLHPALDDDDAIRVFRFRALFILCDVV